MVYPIYGPYGYSIATNANSGIRRMVSGYTLRQHGTSRTTIPEWATRLFNVSSNQVGPPFTGIHTNGCYMEDNDYLGDVINSATGTNYQQGVDFDLDQYNGRYCDTPDFPGGTYAYFVAINSNGAPVFPYNIGFGYYGNPAGGSVVAITEPVVTNFLGNTNLSSSLGLPILKPGAVILTWSSIEGGSYEVLSATNLTSSWSTVSTGNKSAPNQVTTSYTNTTSLPNNFYQVARTSVATYDTAGATYMATNVVASSGSPGAAHAGQYVLLTIDLPSSPPNPPAGATITSVTVGGNSAISFSYPTQGRGAGACSRHPAAVRKTIVVTFNPMPTYTLNGYFSVN